MKGTALTVLGTIIAVAAIGAWFLAAPAAGSGWILFVAFLGCIGLLNSISNRATGLEAGAALVITIAAAAAWWFHRGFEDAGWVGFLAILTGLRTFQAINSSVAANTKAAKNVTKDSNEPKS